MAHRVQLHQTSARDRRQVPTQLEFEIWCLLQAIEEGRWCEAGINRELYNGEVVGYWKVLRNGSMLAVEVIK